MRSGLLLLLSLLLGMGGCSHAKPAPPSTQPLLPPGLTQPHWMGSVQAAVTPPAGWARQPLRSSSRHWHETWVSPGHSTAYGVLHFKLPLPVGVDLVRWGFLREMKRRYPDTRLLSSSDDPQLPGLRFEAEGGPYRIRVNLMVDGWQGWAVYAGTLRQNPISVDELELALRARDFTRVGEGEKWAASERGGADDRLKDRSSNEARGH